MRRTGLDEFRLVRAAGLSAVAVSLLLMLGLGVLTGVALKESPPSRLAEAARQIQSVEDARADEVVYDLDGRLHAVTACLAETGAARQIQWVECSSGLLAIVIPCEGPVRYYRVPNRSWLEGRPNEFASN